MITTGYHIYTNDKYSKTEAISYLAYAVIFGRCVHTDKDEICFSDALRNFGREEQILSTTFFYNVVQSGLKN